MIPFFHQSERKLTALLISTTTSSTVASTIRQFDNDILLPFIGGFRHKYHVNKRCDIYIGKTRRSFHHSCLFLSSSSSSYSIEDDNNRKKKRHRQISFITDIEGDASYFDRFVQNSKVLDFESIKPNFGSCANDKENTVNDYFPYDKQVIFKCISNDSMEGQLPPILVCGGDMWDKGGADLYVTRQLLSLQRRYGDDRVHFILGNRDINKMRIIQELGIGDVMVDDAISQIHDENNSAINQSSQLPFHGGVYWLHGSGLVGDTDLIQKAKEYMNENNDMQKLPNEYANAMVPSSSAADRLKWILKKTMGSPDAFELRRLELFNERKFRYSWMEKFSNDSLQDNSSMDVTDDDVVTSYRHSTHPVHGIMGHYLSKGKLALCLGGVMFMHGSLPFTPSIVKRYIEYERSKNIDKSTSEFWMEFYRYALPFLDEDKSGIQTISISNTSDWVDALNTFSKEQIAVWMKNVTNYERTKMKQVKSPDNCHVSEPMWCTEGGYQHTSLSHNNQQPFGSLNQYGMGWLPFPERSKNPTVVYDSWLNEGMPRRFYGKDELDVAYTKMVCEFFNHSKLDVIVTGHQPGRSLFCFLVVGIKHSWLYSNMNFLNYVIIVGDIPFAIQLPKLNHNDNNNINVDQKLIKPKMILCADTSYSGDTIWIDTNNNNGRKNLGRGTSASGRGDVAVTEILMNQCVDTGHIVSTICHGVLSDGSSYETSNYLEACSDTEENDVGKLVDRSKFVFEGSVQDDTIDEVDWWIKSKFLDGTFLVSSTKGYAVFNSIASKR